MGKQLFLVAALAAATAVEGVAANEEDAVKWIQAHGFLMWSSFGFLFPLSVILIRFSRPQGDPSRAPHADRVKLLFYLHVFTTVLAVVCATVGFAILVNRVGWITGYTHERLGLALLIIMWIMPFIGLARPSKGVAARPYWFVLHWVFGTGALILGIVNCYIGIHVYELIFQVKIRSVAIAFSCLLAFLAVVYFVQDKWVYILNQRNRPSSEQDDTRTRKGSIVSVGNSAL